MTRTTAINWVIGFIALYFLAVAAVTLLAAG
jgi:hypothetical protein